MLLYVTKEFPVYFHDGVEIYKVGRSIVVKDWDELRIAEGTAMANGGEVRLLSGRVWA